MVKRFVALISAVSFIFINASYAAASTVISAPCWIPSGENEYDMKTLPFYSEEMNEERTGIILTEEETGKMVTGNNGLPVFKLNG